MKTGENTKYVLGTIYWPITFSVRCRNNNITLTPVKNFASKMIQKPETMKIREQAMIAIVLESFPFSTQPNVSPSRLDKRQLNEHVVN